MDRGAWWATVHGVARVRQDLVTKEQVDVHLEDVVIKRQSCQVPRRCMLNWASSEHQLIESEMAPWYNWTLSDSEYAYLSTETA